MKQKNYYEILGVSEGADADEIKKAYRKLAKEYHPDTHQGDASAEAKFKEIGEAHDVLKDPAKRRKYDELRRYSAGGGAGESMSYEDFMSRFGGQRSGNSQEFTWGFGGDNLDDIFSSLFGGSARTSRRSRKNPGAFHFDFSGGGARSGAARGATGRASARGSSARGASGSEPQKTADPFFKRKGRDAYVDIPVNLAQVLLGTTLRVRTPQGKKVNVKIPAGGEPDAVLRLRGMGYADMGAQGDLYIRTHLKLPAQLSEEQREQAAALFRQWGLKF